MLIDLHLLSRSYALEKASIYVKFKLVLKSIVRLLFCVHLKKDSLANNLLIYSTARSDLLNLVDSYQKNLFLDNSLRIYPRFSLSKILINLRFLLSPCIRWKSFSKAINYVSTHSLIELSYVNKLILVVWHIEAVAFLEEIRARQRTFPTELYIFQEMNFFEYLVAVFLNGQGTKTIGLQHGIYRDTGAIVTANNTNPINYLICPCHRRFCWGQFSQNVFAKYSVDSTILGRASLLFTQKKYQHTSRVGGPLILFDSIQQSGTNDLMERELAKIYSILVVRYHPDYGAKEFDNHQMPTVIFGNNSTVMLEYLGAVDFFFLLASSDFASLCPSECVKVWFSSEVVFIKMGLKHQKILAEALISND